MAVTADAAAKYREGIGLLMLAFEELIARDEEYEDIGLGGLVVDSDFSDITALQFTDGVAAAQAVIVTIRANGANLYRASDGAHR